MDVTTDRTVNQSIDCDDQSLRTDCSSNGNNSTGVKDDNLLVIDDQGSVTIGNGSHLINMEENLTECKKPRLETTQLFKDYVSDVKKQIGEKKRAEWTLKESEEPRIGNRRLRYQKARKSTNPIQSNVSPFLLCFASKPKSGKHKENGETMNTDDAKESEFEAGEDLNNSKESINDEVLENNSVRILTTENDQESSDAVLELTFDEPKKELNAKESETTENSIQIKKEIISDEMLENNSIKIVTENDVQGSSDAILELTFDEPKKASDERYESDEDFVRIKKENPDFEVDEDMNNSKESMNDEMLENNSIKIVTENDVQGSSDAILELTFDEPRKSSDHERTDSREDSTKKETRQIKKETINDEILEHNSIKIVTTEKDNHGSSNAILELTFDEPKKN